VEIIQHESLERLVEWRAPIEILLIALGLYFLYRSLSAMGAWKIVVGILVGLAVFAGARLLGFTGIEWILSRFGSVALVALIVLFQPEIRRIFERAGSLRRKGRRAQDPGLAELLADVLFDLTRRGWGAIVVLPGRESLTSWTSRGIPLNATPSFPLLTSIFDPNSPGHDGAVMLEGGKLTAFGVRLPLSTRGGLPEGYGTRHHAALGLSESTDALVLAVSEEQRGISAFLGGRLQPIESREALVTEVNEQWERVLGRGQPFGPTRRRLVSLPLLGSVVVATMFWLAIVPRRGEQLEMSFPVPVEYTATPNRLSLLGERVDRARMIVAGTAADLSRVDPYRVRVRVDLSGLGPGRLVIPLTLNEVELPRGVQLRGVEPSSLVVEALPLVERELRIRPQLVGSPPEGSRLEVVEVRPRSLRALVPEGGPDPPSEIPTAPIQVAGITGLTQVISTVVAPSGIRPSGDRWPDVVVTVTIRRGQNAGS
jgi:DNA integrity scanning protein DisA with diadenylate cyclase activity